MVVLVISVHPDDETLGCGGTILKHLAIGHQVHWLIVTKANVPQWSLEMVRLKAHEIQEVANSYRFTSYIQLDFAPTLLDTVPQGKLIEEIHSVFQEIKPTLVYMIHGGDVHSDHRVVYTATTSVVKPFVMRKLGVCRVLSYETLSSTEGGHPKMENLFAPNCLNDITPYIDRKLEIMEYYQTEIQSDPFPRGPSAIRALARYRGATIGVEYAEAFMLIRELM